MFFRVFEKCGFDQNNILFNENGILYLILGSCWGFREFDTNTYTEFAWKTVLHSKCSHFIGVLEFKISMQSLYGGVLSYSWVNFVLKNLSSTRKVESSFVFLKIYFMYRKKGLLIWQHITNKTFRAKFGPLSKTRDRRIHFPSQFFSKFIRIA